MLELLKFDEPDPDRAEKEGALRKLDEAGLRSLYRRTRDAAKVARTEKNMEELYRLVRGTKTIQRIADEQGILITSRKLR